MLLSWPRCVPVQEKSFPTFDLYIKSFKKLFFPFLVQINITSLWKENKCLIFCASPLVPSGGDRLIEERWELRSFPPFPLVSHPERNRQKNHYGG